MNEASLLYAAFEKTAAEYNEATALIFKDEAIAYKQLRQRADAICMAVLQYAADEQYIGISATRSIDMIAGVLGILKAGKVYLPLDVEYPEARLKQLIQTAELRYVICADNEVALLGSLGLEQIGHATGTDIAGPPFYTANACILFTSGSTGVPKGVCLTQRGLLHRIHHQHQLGLAQAGTRTLQYSHLSFDAAFLEIFVPLTTGGTLYLPEDDVRLNAGNLLAYITGNRIERLFLAYAVVQFLAEIAAVHNNYPGTVKEIITGGELLRITPAIRSFFRQMPQCRLMNVYGPTETSVWVTELVLDGDTAYWPDIPSLGFTLPGADIALIDEQLNAVAGGAEGEILIYGAGIADGYLNQPQLTRERFIDWTHPGKGTLKAYRTGDLAVLNDDGSYQFRGRKDSQVKIRGGHRVELSEIEVVVAAIHGVSQVKVVVREDVPGDRRIVAYIIVTKPVTEEVVKAAITARLPAYMLPDHVVRLQQFRYTVSGKIDARALPKPGSAEIVEEEPGNEQEEYLRGVWKEVLDVPALSLYDNFFELGGNSLAAIRLMIRIEKDLGRHLPLASVFQHPTVAALAATLHSDPVASPAGPLVPLKTSGKKPPVYLLHGDNLNAVIFSGIARHVSAEQPVYGLQAKGLDGSGEPIASIEEMARYYIDAILKHDRSGRYAIAGYSFGGYVAAEMAHQLEASGKQVIMLGMIDCDAQYTEHKSARPVNVSKKLSRQIPKLRWMLKSFIAHPADALSNQARHVANRLRDMLHLGLAAEPGTEAYVVLMNKINTVHHRGLSQYTLHPYSGIVHLFKAMKRPYFVDDFKYLGWKKYAREVVVHNIPGDHSTMTDEPNCMVLAREMEKAVDLGMQRYESFDTSSTT